jgi:Domain of unknown function (DUF4405)
MTISRDWATPLTIGAFLLMAVTGILMFFHLDSGLNKEAHEWLGWAMVIGVGVHVIANWAGFKRYFSKGLSQAIVGLFAALLIGSFFIGGEDGGSPAGLAIQTLNSATVAQLAAIRHEAPEAMIERLKAAGFMVTGADQTLNAVTGGKREQVGKALRAALPPQVVKP